jgi:hypothetical protein
LAEPVFNFGLVGLAENFMLGVQSCDSKNDPIAVRLVISVNTQVFVALLGESSQYSFQNSLRGRIWDNFVHNLFIVGVLL